MPKIDQVLIDLVKEEAAKLREALKPKEAANLNFENLQPENYWLCIYGQATGDCNSIRATDLIRGCCSKTYNTFGDGLENAVLNGAPTVYNIYPYQSQQADERMHFSPIEIFIVAASPEQNEKLIQYLRKETDTLDI